MVNNGPRVRASRYLILHPILLIDTLVLWGARALRLWWPCRLWCSYSTRSAKAPQAGHQQISMVVTPVLIGAPAFWILSKFCMCRHIVFFHFFAPAISKWENHSELAGHTKSWDLHSWSLRGSQIQGAQGQAGNEMCETGWADIRG